MHRNQIRLSNRECWNPLIPGLDLRKFGRQPRYTFGTMNAQIER